MATLFTHPHTLPADFVDESVYVFYLRPDAGAATGPPEPAVGQPSGADAVSLMDQIRFGSRSGAGVGAAGGAAFRPNVVVMREKTARALADVVADQRRFLAERAPKLRFVQEGPMKVAGLGAHQVEFAAKLDEPRVDIVQWQVTTIRDGYAYCFHCTTDRGRWPKDKARFEAFIAGWR